MNAFDLRVYKWLFAFVHRCPGLDSTLRHLVNDDFLKGGIIMAIFWWQWFRKDKNAGERREFLFFAFVSSAAAVVLGRLLALMVPYQARPGQNPLCDFPFPATAPGDLPRSWNSFPSDHSILFFCLAASLCMVSNRAGIFALCHAIFVICVPRIYMGYHYPSDIVAGALLGIAVAYTVRIAKLRKWVARPALLWMERHTASFYAVAFLWTFEVTELFRTLLSSEAFIRHGLRALL